jgi:hypothetical protein
MPFNIGFTLQNCYIISSTKYVPINQTTSVDALFLERALVSQAEMPLHMDDFLVAGLSCSGVDWVPKVPPTIKQCVLVVCCTHEVKFMLLVDGRSLGSLSAQFVINLCRIMIPW